MTTPRGSAFLLDSHALLYLAQHPDRLPRRLRTLLEDGRNELHVSIASVWEIQIKTLLGKLTLDMPLDRLITTQREENGLQLLPINLPHIVEHERLPMHHRDPFDRMLIAQARVEGLTVLSHDAAFAHYDVKVKW